MLDNLVGDINRYFIFLSKKNRASVGTRKDMSKIGEIQWELDGKSEEEAAHQETRDVVKQWVERPKDAALKKVNIRNKIESEQRFLQENFAALQEK